MRRVFWSSVVVAALIAFCAIGVSQASGRVVETFPEVATEGIRPVEYFQAQDHLHAWLVSEMTAGALDTPIRIRVSSEEMAELDRVDEADPGKTVVGLTKVVARTVDLSDAAGILKSGKPGRIAGGTISATDDGGFVWTAAITSSGAKALRVKFANLDLPTLSDLFVYSLRGQAFGPYRGDMDGEVWSHTLLDSSAVIQLRHYGPAGPQELSRLRFTIAELGHIGPKFMPAALAPPVVPTDLASAIGSDADAVSLLESATSGGESTDAFCTFNEACVENAECGGPSWSSKADAQNATALMLWVSGAFINTCSGGLLADMDSSSQIPYFLTANHCLSKNRDARNIDFFFDFTTSCGGGCPPQWTGGGIQQTGSQVLATNRTGDYTLLQLDNAPPSGAVFMGWTTADVANSNGTALYRISHPSTAPQAYTVHSVDTSAGTCQGIPRGDWIYSRDTHGATEGGSSGSPVYNGAGQVVGQLTGACGFNTGDPCDAASNATIDGAFANYYGSIAQYLNPSPCSPSPEVCDNGSDDDCDGDADCDDADCSGDPACDSGGDGCVNPGGSPAGSGCSSNADCCSNKCKGPPSNSTCR